MILERFGSHFGVRMGSRIGPKMFFLLGPVFGPAFVDFEILVGRPGIHFVREGPLGGLARRTIN